MWRAVSGSPECVAFGIQGSHGFLRVPQGPGAGLRAVGVLERRGTVRVEMEDMTNWTHRVVKRMRGMQGEYFDFPTARTFSGASAEADARAYAECFAREQGHARVYGARIEVRTRKGGWTGHRGATVATYRSEDYLAEAQP